MGSSWRFTTNPPLPLTLVNVRAVEQTGTRAPRNRCGGNETENGDRS